MKHRVYIVVVLCLSMVSAILAQDPTEESAGKLPDVNELLHQASEYIASLEHDAIQMNFTRQLATLFARSNNLDAAFEILNRSLAEAERWSKREIFTQLVEDVALHRSAETALQIAKECPSEYRMFVDDKLFGSIALTAAHREDAQGAWTAIDAIKETNGYPYELIVAQTLDDKIRGRKVVLESHEKLVTAMEGRKNLAREEWAGIVWMLSFYEWCGLSDESKELLDQACQTAENPKEFRTDILKELRKQIAKKPNPSNGAATRKQASVEEICQMAASVSDLRTPEQKARQLLNVAKMVLEYGNPPIATSCD